MLSATLSLALASLPPYLVTNKGSLTVETPSGQVITIPENSTFTVNRIKGRVDFLEITLDNAEIFRDGFE